MLLVVYVDDILLIDSDAAGIKETKEYLRTHFVTNDVRKPQYFLDIKFTYTKEKMALSQKKYVHDLL